MRDKDTCQPREHDIVITYVLSHHEIVLALECRDRHKPVGVPDVEQFRAKCLATGIHQGVIVSSNGFAKTALNKAREMDIGCLSLLDVEAFDWCQAPGMELDYRHLKHLDVAVMLGRDVGEKPEAFFVKDQNGNEVDGRARNRMALKIMNELGIELEPCEGIGLCLETREPVWQLFDIKGQSLPVDSFRFIASVDQTFEVINFNFLQYIDALKDKSLTSVALVNVDRPGLRGRFMFLRNESGETQVAFVRDKSKEEDSDLVGIKMTVTSQSIESLSK